MASVRSQEPAMGRLLMATGSSSSRGWDAGGSRRVVEIGQPNGWRPPDGQE